GYKRFFRRTLLEQSDYLKNDCLSVHCSVGVVKSHTEGPKFYSIAVPPSRIGHHFGQLLKTGKGTDVSFEVDGEVFYAHKLVLAARSPVFRAQLFGPMKEQNTKQIKVEDIEAPVFKVQSNTPLLMLDKNSCYFLTNDNALFLETSPCKLYAGVADAYAFEVNLWHALLHFMYWDSLPDMQELTGLDSKWVTTLMSQHLLAAADRYGLERLRLLCESNLCEDVAINTVATTLALAEQHHCFQLKAVCLKFVAVPENLRAVMQTDGFVYLKESCPSVMTELLEYVARVIEHSVYVCKHGIEPIFDGSDANGRRVKQRLPCIVKLGVSGGRIISGLWKDKDKKCVKLRGDGKGEREMVKMRS
ncbi:hypothetical protein Goklo_014654, partial [Gossypium klotzschianum]|nr:hypothetical protein [Gossypium klotzschianum]